MHDGPNSHVEFPCFIIGLCDTIGDTECKPALALTVRYTVLLEQFVGLGEELNTIFSFQEGAKNEKMYLKDNRQMIHFLLIRISGGVGHI